MESPSQPPAPATTIVSLPEAGPSAADDAPSEGAGAPSFEKGAGLSSGVSGGSVASSDAGGAAYLDNPKPEYPPQARKMGMEGTVLLNVLVSREGRTLKIEIVKSSGHDILDRAAAQAVERWRFVPARRGNVVLEQWVQVPLTFRIHR